VPLRAALNHLEKIHQAVESSGEAETIHRIAAIQALGYEKPNGKVHRLIAAMRGYGLLAVPEKGKPEFVVTPLGKRLLKSPKARANGPWLAAAREAVLAPPLFRNVWNRARDLDRDQLVEALLQRGFTEQGAEKAAAVFTRNRQIARLDDMPEGMEPPMRPGATAAKKAARKAARRSRALAGMGGGECDGEGPLAPTKPNRPLGPPRDAVVLPLGNKRAIIPTGITQDDYDLLVETLTLWKGKIVKTDD
jgi:hypothetical protein